MFTEASRTFQDIYGKNLRKASTSLHQLSSLFLSVKPWSFAYLVYSDFKLENGCTASRIFSVLPQLLSITTQALSDAGYKVFHHVHRCPSDPSAPRSPRSTRSQSVPRRPGPTSGARPRAPFKCAGKEPFEIWYGRSAPNNAFTPHNSFQKALRPRQEKQLGLAPLWRQLL